MFVAEIRTGVLLGSCMQQHQDGQPQAARGGGTVKGNMGKPRENNDKGRHCLVYWICSVFLKPVSCRFHSRGALEQLMSRILTPSARDEDQISEATWSCVWFRLSSGCDGTC